MRSAAALVALCEAAGLAARDLACAETPTVLNRIFHVTGTAAAAIPDKALFAVVNECSTFARVELRTAGLVELTLTPAMTLDDIAAFRSRVAGSPQLELVVTVDKAALLSDLILPASGHAIVFLFGAAFQAALRSGLTGIESGLWAGRGGQLVVLVLDTEIALRGPCLTVLGGANIPCPVAVDSFKSIRIDALKRVVSVRDRLIGWDEPFTTELTPWHFATSGTAPGSIRDLIDARLVDMTMLFTCDRARRLQPAQTGPIQTEFRGRDHVAFVALDERAPMPGLDDGQREALLRAVDWTYQLEAVVEQRPDWAADRLPFLQTRVAQVLESRPEAERLRGFVSAMPSVIEGVEWNWKAFVEGKVSGYLDQVKELEEVVTDTTDKVSGIIGDQIKALSDTMLAAVGVLIGTFIAAAFDTPFNSTVFRIGLVTYAAYVLLFPAATGMFAAWRQLDRAQESFNFRRRSFIEALGEERVEQILGDRLTSVRSSFHKTLLFVTAVYIAVTVGAIVAAVVVPVTIVDTPAPAETGHIDVGTP